MKTLAVIAIALLVVLIVAALAYAHQAPTGWMYDMDCCGGLDCEEMETKVDTLPVGYLIEETREMISYTDKRIRHSQDEYYHRCHYTTDFKKTRCLYVPESAY